MAGGGYYDQHSQAQRSAGSFGLPLLERAVAALPQLTATTPPVVIADYGAAGGRNELGPMGLAVGALRARGIDQAIAVVHTDIPENDFNALFENLEHSPDTYLGRPDVFAFVAGRSFYEQIFPPRVVTLGWSAIAVHWLSRVPAPIPNHIYCSFATGKRRDELAAQSAEDWQSFLAARACEMRSGAQLVVAGGAATDDGASGAEALMDALNQALRFAAEHETLAATEYERMTVPTWNRTLDDFAAPFKPGSAVSEAGLDLVERSLAVLPDQYLNAYRASHDASAYADATVGFLRAFTEPSLFASLDRPADQRAAIANEVYGTVRRQLAADPESFETQWRVALLRIVRK
jgi:hypothetical protein